jgi:[acyl-carrier-protein] S-malonyltransferase
MAILIPGGPGTIPEDAEPRANLAWVFPGQGAQAVGMGRDLYERYDAAREIFDAADHALGFKLSTLCFEGPEDELRQTVNTQPAIVTTSIACFAAAYGRLDDVKGAPAFVAGHSLGEYSALIAAGSLDFRDGVRLVRERGRLMQDAGERNPGTLAAVMGADEAVVEEVCQDTGAEICNVNGAGQIVIGGTREAVVRALELAKARGAKIAPLNVSGAFHSSLMRPAMEGMRRALSLSSLIDPRIPIIGNCEGKPLTTARAIKDELEQQVASAVQWQRSVEYMLRAGVSTFVEIGPGRALTGLIRRIARGASVRNVGDASAIEGAGEKA